jgi:hypothetical protein
MVLKWSSNEQRNTDVDIRPHILPAPRQPRLPRLYIGTIYRVMAGYSIFDGTQFEGSPFPKSLLIRVNQKNVEHNQRVLGD